MKIGDFVRFKTLSREIKIGKVIEIIAPDKNSMKKYCVYDLDNNEATVDDYVIKSSPNIIDLIEVGDYVNGHRVVEVDLDDIDDYGNDFRYIKTEHDFTLNHWVKEYEIETIVTKEMYANIEYRVETH